MRLAEFLLELSEDTTIPEKYSGEARRILIELANQNVKPPQRDFYNPAPTYIPAQPPYRVGTPEWPYYPGTVWCAH